MLERIKILIKKSKAVLIVTLILWVILSILLVAPLTVAIVEANATGTFVFDTFFNNFLESTTKIGDNLLKVFTKEYVPTYFKVDGWFTIVLLLFATIGFVKSMPKSEYTYIEHRIK